MSIYEKCEKHAHRTFAEAARKYLAEFKGKAKERAEQSLRSVLPYIGELRCIDVDDEALAEFKHDRTNGVGHFTRPAMAGTVCKDLTQVVTTLNKAARVWRWIPSAPKIEHVEGDTRKAYPLTWDEQSRLFCQLPTGWDVGFGVFAINTGCRKEEILGLKWTDLVPIPELGPEVFVFILRDTKNSHQRAVICNSIARRCVEVQRQWQSENQANDYVFPQTGGSKVRGAGKVWQQAWARAGLPTGRLVKRGVHNCRHSFGHRLRAAGVPQEDRNALLGHANTNLAEHYATPDIERLLAHAEKVTIRRETTVLRDLA